MSARSVAVKHSRQRVQLRRTAEREAVRLWRQVERGNIARSWASLMPRLLVVLTAAQQSAAAEADAYVASVLAQQGLAVDAARVNPAKLAGIASDGRELETLLMQPVITSKVALARGAPVTRALLSGQASLQMIVGTQVADAGRVADGVALTAQRDVTGYVRMLVGGTCSRCAILAGRRYRWNAGFDRHPRCDCIGVPAREDAAGDIMTDPKAYFRSLSRQEQDKAFTAAGAQAIRDGADINQVVNARRGALGLTPAGARITAAEARALRGDRQRGRLQTADVFGHQLYTTTEGVTTRGLAGVRLGARENGQKDGGRYRTSKGVRLMPEAVYKIAGNDRDEAIRLLRRFGYLI